ncbi:transcriptional repressor [Bdellovibrionota bacterium FG-2]
MSRRESSNPKNQTLSCGRPNNDDFILITHKEQEKWHELLNRYLQQKQLKQSEQRWKIVQLILSIHGHMSAQEIVQQVMQTYPDIGAATVYRNIKLLCDAKILKETLVDTVGRSVYEVFNEKHHDHIVCEDCGHTFEFQNQELEALQDRIAKKFNFQPTRHRHVIYGECLFKAKR